MKLKMLASMAGVGFALQPGDETDQFDDDEAGRLIENGFAEKAAAKKPASKEEWAAERAKLLDERAAEQAEYEAFKAREADMQKQIDDLTEFKVKVVAMIPAAAQAGAIETTEAAGAPETR